MVRQLLEKIYWLEFKNKKLKKFERNTKEQEENSEYVTHSYDSTAG